MDIRLPPPFPRITPLFVKLAAPVPQRLVPKMPAPIAEASRLGISEGTRAVPNCTRPLASTTTFGYVPAVTLVFASCGLG